MMMTRDQAVQAGQRGGPAAVGRGGTGKRFGRVAAALVVAAVSAGLVAGCSSGDGYGSGGKKSHSPGGGASSSPGGHASDQGPTGKLTEDQRERRALVPRAKIGYARAADAAVGRVKGGSLAEIELKNADDAGGKAGGHPQWIAKVAPKDGTEHRVHVDAVTGKVLSSRVKPDQDSDDRKKLAGRLAKAKKTPKQAAGIATGRKHGTVTSIELDDNDKGTVIWSVDVVTPKDWNKTTFDVDVTDGRVTREHVDRD